jgi:hypothetical protein
MEMSIFEIIVFFFGGRYYMLLPAKVKKTVSSLQKGTQQGRSWSALPLTGR